MTTTTDAKEQLRLTGAQCLVRALEDAGVDTVFGYPGGQALDIFDALYDSQVIKTILTRHEQGATHAGDGYARATGKCGTVVVTSGPGACNTVTGIATAYMDSVPLVVICGQVPTNVLGTDAFQESDITGITMPIVKHSFLIKDEKEIATTVAQAYHIASTGRPGPVLIDVPSNFAQAKNVLYDFPAEVKLESYKPNTKGHKRQVKQAARLLEKAERPVILAGGGILSSHACKPLKELAHRRVIPVATTLIGKGGFDEFDELYLGMPGIHGKVTPNKALQESDVILAVGTRFAERTTGKVDAFAPNAQIIHIDIDPAEIDKNLSSTVPIVGDATLVLQAILDELNDDNFASTQAWIEHMEQLKREEPNPLEYTYGDADGLTAPKVLAELSHQCENVETIFTTEVGQHQMWSAQMLKLHHTRGFLSSGGAGTMGFGLPAAMGAAFGKPECRIVSLCGDGSLQMNMQEMATIIENGLPVKVLVFNNNCLGMVRQLQEYFYDKRYSATLFSANPDFVMLAQAFGWGAYRCDNINDLSTTMNEWLTSDGPALLDVSLTREENVYPMVPSRAPINEMIVGPDSAEDNDAQKDGE